MNYENMKGYVRKGLYATLIASAVICSAGCSDKQSDLEIRMEEQKMPLNTDNLGDHLKDVRGSGVNGPKEINTPYGKMDIRD